MLRWDEGFEAFLRERNRCGKVLTEETLKYYRSLFNLFKRYLEGKEVSEQLIDCGKPPEEVA